MTDTPLQERLLEQFGDACRQSRYPRRLLSPLRRHQLSEHQKWLLSDGRFGRQFKLRNHRIAFTNADLDAEDFSKVELVNTRFSWSNLRCTRFVGAYLKRVEFEACDLEAADFTDAIFDDVSFNNCLDLDKACFQGVCVVSGELPVQARTDHSSLVDPAPATPE